MAHTPGPWRIDDDRRDEVQIVGRPTWRCTRFGVKGEWDVATIEPNDTRPKEAIANARLIVAAPDLLEALKSARQFITNGVEFGYIRMPDAGTPDSAHDTLPMIEAAIARAEGC